MLVRRLATSAAAAAILACACVPPAQAADQARKRCSTPRGATVEQRLPTAIVAVRTVDDRGDRTTTAWVCHRRTGVNRRFLSLYSTFQESITLGRYGVRGRFVGYGVTAIDHYGGGTAHVVVRDPRRPQSESRRVDLSTFNSPGLAPASAAAIRQIALSAKGDPAVVLRRTPYAPSGRPAAPTVDELRDPRATIVASGPPGTIEDPAVERGRITWTQDGARRSAPLVDFSRPLLIGDLTG